MDAQTDLNLGCMHKPTCSTLCWKAAHFVFDRPKEFKQIGIVEPKTVEKENKVKEVEMDNDVIEDEAMPVPQVTIGPDGNIVVNETR